MLNIGFVSLCAQFGFNPEEAGRFYDKSKRLLEKQGNLTSPDQLIVHKEQAMEAVDLLKESNIELLVIQVGTFPSGELIPILIDELNVPILLWALPEPPFDGGHLQFNSLCGTHLIASLLKRKKKKFKYIHVSPEEDTSALTIYLKAFKVARDLKQMKVGLVGTHAPGFDAMAVDAPSLKEIIGPEVVTIGLDDVFIQAESIQQTHRDTLLQEIGQEFHNAKDIPREKLDKFANTYASMEKMVEQHNVSSVAVRCWPEFIEDYGQAVCGTVSKLTDGGIVSGCEGDILGTITSSMMYEFSGEPPFLADIIHAEYETNELTLWHCGAAPFSLAAGGEEIILGEEFGIGGLNVEFPLKEGIVTLARLGYLDGEYRMLITTGEAKKIGPIVRGTVAQVKADVNVKKLMDELIYEGWEHHLSMAYNDVSAELEELCGILGIECIRV